MMNSQHSASTYPFWNNLLGWITFIFALVVYTLTVEPTVSFWDCGEFIACSDKLMIGHPPGAPLYLMVGRLFSMWASVVEQKALYVNMLSVVSSAGTILFLFWTITYLGKKALTKASETLSLPQITAVLSAGLVGAIAFTFSDTFWYSAVEAEVYALSSLFTAITFWLILKWESNYGKPYNDRYLILIAYLIGLSIGVHLLSLLTIPSVVLVYFFKHYPFNRRNIIRALLVSILILFVVQALMTPLIVRLGAQLDLYFVNSLGLAKNLGLSLWFFLLLGGCLYGAQYYTKKGKKLLVILSMSLFMLILGYGSYAMVLVRAQAQPYLTLNDPNHGFQLLSYLNRDQYGSAPLLYGQHFNTERDKKEPFKITGNIYDFKDDNYFVKKQDFEINYGSKQMFFPRLWSQSHKAAYLRWLDKKSDRYEPSFADNISFFINYQVIHMYWRYFMWNFSGRQDDYINHFGDNFHGNWISGIPFIDNTRLGDQSNRPEHFKRNKAHNKYYLLPLILGILGILFQLKNDKKDRQDLITVASLFLFTGLAIIVFLNQPPTQPRERDYAYVGSFYTFAIWIGLGVLFLYKKLQNPSTLKVVILGGGTLVAVPLLMGYQNWDDHDRSKKYLAWNVGHDYLESCDSNGIIFTFGDNGTFPLWYARFVENIRPDVRNANLSYLQADWYIRAMQRATTNPPLPISLHRDQYWDGVRDQVFIREHPSFKGVREELKSAVTRVAQDSSIRFRSGGYTSFFPTRQLKISIQPDEKLMNRYKNNSYTGQLSNEINFNLSGGQIMKMQYLILDMIAHGNWERPFHFSTRMRQSNYLNLLPYFQNTGFTYQLTPLKTSGDDRIASRMDMDRTYDLFMNKAKWKGMGDTSIYYDETNRQMLTHYRQTLTQLALELHSHRKNEQALEIIQKCLEMIPDHILPYSYFNAQIPYLLYQLGDKEQGNAIMKLAIKNTLQEYQYTKEKHHLNGLKGMYQVIHQQKENETFAEEIQMITQIFQNQQNK